MLKTPTEATMSVVDVTTVDQRMLLQEESDAIQSPPHRAQRFLKRFLTSNVIAPLPQRCYLQIKAEHYRHDRGALDSRGILGRSLRDFRVLSISIGAFWRIP